MKQIILIFLSLLVVESVTIISNYTGSGYIHADGIAELVSTHTITLSVTQSDFGNTYHYTLLRTNGSTSDVAITLGGIFTAYTNSIQGYVFEDGELRAPEACFTRDPARYTPTGSATSINVTGVNDSSNNFLQSTKKIHSTLTTLSRKVNHFKAKMKALNLDNSDSFLMTSFLKAIPIFGGPLSGLICLGFGGCGTQVTTQNSLSLYGVILFLN